jgi:RNA recognition motif-containing protein
MSVRLYIGNLPKEVERQELASLFSEFDESTTKVITDRKTGKCRGFGFVTVKTDEQADQLIEKFNGYSFKDSELKIEKALPRTKGKEDEEDGAEESAPAPAASSSGNRRNKGNNKSNKKSSSSESDSVTPDPRWAQELEKLKQLLAAQAAN